MIRKQETVARPHYPRAARWPRPPAAKAQGEQAVTVRFARNERQGRAPPDWLMMAL